MSYLLLVIDFQERLLKHIHGSDDVLRSAVKLIRACRVLGVPIILTEQIKLGETIREVREAAGVEPILKSSFSCVKCEQVRGFLEKIRPKAVILAGIEAHICILQTALDLLELGYRVYIPVDCIGSRRPIDKEVAVQRMISAGAIPTTWETLVYEMLGSAEHEKFREILEIVKSSDS
ncbi:MAG: hydrolase [Aigarchaeota archaeon]|nr:hydrolase [Candidatus Wolframiiraptor gerlachensis]